MPKITLKAARVNAGLSQSFVAKTLNVATSTLRNWENGITYPNQPHIDTLCSLYGMEYDNIFFGAKLAKS